MKKSFWITLTVVAVVLSVLLSAANLFLGDLNQDEGWYLYAARLVSDGNLLYRDFMFTQGPVMPMVYGLLYPVVEKLGVAGGRLITAFFGLATAGLAFWLAMRSAKRFRIAAGLFSLLFVGVNVYQSYFTTIVKTYGVCAFFLTAGFVALSFADRKRGASGAFWGGFLLALAACTRLSAGIALPIAGVWLIVNRKKVYPYGHGVDVPAFSFHPSYFRFLPAWLAFGLGGGLVLLALLGIFWVQAPENTQFALFGYHAGRSPGGLVQWAALKAGFVSRFVQGYFLFAMGCVIAFVFRKHHRHVREADPAVWDVQPHLIELLRQANDEETPFSHGFISLLWLTGLGITLVHFTAPFPYDDYQVIAMPVLMVALGATLAPCCSEKWLERTAVVLLLVSTASAFSSPINQSWLISGRDRIWWTFKKTPDLIALRQAGQMIREQLDESDLLLTQDTYLAIEANANVPRGLEMGPFSYYPELSREEARKFNLLNEEMFTELLKSCEAPVAAISGYGLTIACPEISELSTEHQQRLRGALESAYQKTDEIESFGQAHTTLEIFSRR
jgi:hypothetical protein